MNKSWYLVHWLLVTITLVSLVATGRAGVTLWQTNKLNQFIKNPGDHKLVPEHEKAQFAQAYTEAQQGKSSQALERLTKVITSDDQSLQTAAYYNRGNIHLREAQALMEKDMKELALIELAKQDYRTALLIDPTLWNARFNLELALSMAPEKPTDGGITEKPKVIQKKVKTVGFSVHLP